jgi:parallel beta-helix repeat protein
MAYSTNNGMNAISVTTLGANGNGVFDNKTILQNAVNSLYSKGGGSLFFPKGAYYYSGTVDVTGRDISFLGEDGSVLVAARDESAKKFNVSGAKRILFSALTFDSNRTGTTHDSNQYGFVNSINTDNLTVQGCNFFNTRNSAIYLGGGTRFATINDNFFTGHFCGVYGYINAGESGSEQFLITNNKFGVSWPGNTNESACIKLQSAGGAYSKGHVIDSNLINSYVQMGIELWANGRDSVISNNTIKGTAWGISLDGQENDTVAGNTIKGVSYMGIECASVCKNITISDNAVDGYTGYLSVEARNTQYGLSSSNTPCERIIYNGNTVEGCGFGLNIQNAFDTVIANNVIRDNNINLNYQAGRRSQVQGNLFDTGSKGNQTSYHVFFDANGSNISGFHLSDNKFRGATTNQSIYYYNNGSSYRVYDVCMENNITDESTLGGFGIFLGGQITPYNYVYSNNFGPRVADGSNSIEDATDLSSLYPTSAAWNGYRFYTRGSLTLTGAINSTSGAWTKIYTRDEGNIQTPRFAIDFAENTPPYDFDSKKDILEFVASKSPYGGGGNIYVLPQCNYVTGNFIEPIAIDNPSAGSVVDVWVKFVSGSAAISGLTVYFYGDESTVASPSLQYQKPNFHSSAVYLGLDQTNRNNLKVTRGVSMGTGADEIYSPLSGYLSTSAIYSAKNYRMDLSGLAPAISNAGASGRLTLDFNNPGLQTVLITGGTVISGTNYYPGAALTVRLFATTPSQALAWAPWTFIGTTTPTGLATSKTAILSLQCFDTTDTGVVAAYSVQP